MLKNILLLVLISCLCFKMPGQNLIPNHGFTFYTLCPSSQNQLNRAFPWVNPNNATPDFYHSCNGGEQYIIVGNFKDSASSHAVLVNSANNQGAYYLIDDVSLINCDSLFIDVNEINLDAVVSFYPNPVKDELTIDFKGYALEDVQVRILDMLGKVQTSYAGKWYNKVKINTGSLTSGLYIVEIRCKNGIVAKRFMKE